MNDHEILEAIYRDSRAVLEAAQGSLPSPHPMWGFLNELMETVSLAEDELGIVNRYKHHESI
jgi:hypothetical protein